METIVIILIFIGVMYAMSKLGLDCCGSKSDHSENNRNKSCCSSEKDKIANDGDID